MSIKQPILATLGGLAAGAGLMYLLDPDRGARRRTQLRRQAVRAGKKGAALALQARRVALNPARLFA